MAVPEQTKTAIPAWNRMPGESAKAHEGALAYFKMGANRSLAAVARQLGKHVSQMERWSRAWAWVARATAFDENLAREDQIVFEKEKIAHDAKWRRRAEEESEQKYQTAQKIRTKAERVLDLPLTKVTHNKESGQTNIHPLECALRDVAPMVTVAFRLSGEAISREAGAQESIASENWTIEDYK